MRSASSLSLESLPQKCPMVGQDMISLSKQVKALSELALRLARKQPTGRPAAGSSLMSAWNVSGSFSSFFQSVAHLVRGSYRSRWHANSATSPEPREKICTTETCRLPSSTESRYVATRTTGVSSVISKGRGGLTIRSNLTQFVMQSSWRVQIAIGFGSLRGSA